MEDNVDDTDQLLELDEYAYENQGATALSCETNRKAILIYFVFLCYLASAGYTITLPSMYLFLQELGVCDSTAFILGVIICLYSLGQVLSTVLLGRLAKRISLSYCILLALLCDVVGNILYAQASSVWMIVPGRLLAGLGAGNVALARRYISSTFPPLSRTSATSYLANAQAIGFICGPALGAIVSFVDFEVIAMQFNAFTTPGYIAALSSLFAALALALFFRQLPKLQGPAPVLDRTSVDNYGAKKAVQRKGIYVLLFVFFIVTQVFVTIETTLTPTTAHYFGWTAQNSDIAEDCDGNTHTDPHENGVLFNGLLFMMMGITAFISLSAMSHYKKLPMFNASGAPSPYLDRGMLIVGWIIMLGGCLVAFPWASDLAVWRFVLGIELMGPLGYCIGQVTALSIYSKIIVDSGDDPTKLMGWISLAGSIARITGPLIAGGLFWADRVNLVITVMFNVLAASFAVVLFSWRILTHEQEAPLAAYAASIQ
eukprot:TRINITY_DN5866_c0_g1_i2.p1 TRINITY_DN5866_c0_g1~~TRINITY_DN5866_c0_g1_i2.p1  ORF type:complete len:486 (-),score=131.12 TRINITY_DN5866_c0_g1_i2:65-1522(-)